MPGNNDSLQVWKPARVGIRSAGWETFEEHRIRSISDEPYSDHFLTKCREKALEYDKKDIFLRGIQLSDLEKCVPMHYRGKVFDGISWVRVI